MTKTDSRYVLGIDAGGTKTVALLADEAGNVVGEARADGANLQTHGELEVEKVFHSLIRSFAGRRNVAAVGLGIAGVDRPRDEEIVRGILSRLGHETIRVVNDAAIALLAGSPDRTGILVLAGTGSIAYGVDPAGRVARAGGYGYLLADEGSGYWLGQRALRAAVRAADGRGPHTPLLALVFEALSVSSLDDLVPAIYERGVAKNQVAALASLVQKAFEAGDGVAAGLIEDAGRELALAAHAVHGKLELGKGGFPLVLAGGAFKACPALAEGLRASLRLPEARISSLDVEPAWGAVRLALDLLA